MLKKNTDSNPQEKKDKNEEKKDTPQVVFEKKKSPVEEVFDKYVKLSLDDDDEEEEFDPNKLRGTGILEYAQDLNIELEGDNGLLLIAWKLNINQEGTNVWEFTREQFVEGWEQLGAKSFDDMKKKLKVWKTEIEKDQSQFDKFYLYTFDYLRVNKKVLPTDESILAWEMLGFPKRWPSLWEQWKKFVENESAIVRDVWKMFGRFVKAHPRDVNNYDTDANWPLIIDEFVEHIKNPNKNEEEEEEED